MSARSIRDVTKSLQGFFASAKVPPSLPDDARRMLQRFVDEHEGKVGEHEAATANQQLRSLWEKFVSLTPAKQGAFIGVLRELRPAIVVHQDILDWWKLVIKPLITNTASKQAALDDAHHFMVGVLTYDEDDDDLIDRANLSSQLARELFGIYISRTQRLTSNEQDVNAADDQLIYQRAESILIAFGKKRPKDFCYGIDDLAQASSTRVHALTLLGSFLRHPVPHLYLIINTPLVDTILKCLMNDTSTIVLSVALNTLIIILSHIPSSLGHHLPRLFLVYSRLLCWEKFSSLSTDAQKNLVIDGRMAAASDDEDDATDVGFDPHWDTLKPQSELLETETPEIKTYFTFLYGLYPLNFMSYIRRPRKYLKSRSFPDADDFDLDQAVIRARSEQFRQFHRLHPNFYHLTIEEELEDPKWIRTDPEDVVADCHALVISANEPPPNLHPPPSIKLPNLPFPPTLQSATSSGRNSPTASHVSLPSKHSWRESEPTVSGRTLSSETLASRPVTAQSNDGSFNPRELPTHVPKIDPSTGPPSPTIEDFPLPVTPIAGHHVKSGDAPMSNVAYLQRQITLLTNELNFEKWHKAQYSQHISQLTRKNVKDATAEAETLNLINANRALKQQIEHVRNAREATLKDSALTRKQAGNLEAHMLERFRAMKKEQAAWVADTAELRKLRDEITQYRELLVACEARELSKTHEIEILQRELDQLRSIQDQLKEANKKIREYEYRDFEFERAKREAEILTREKETLQMKLQRREQDADRAQKTFRDKIAALEVRAESFDAYGLRSPVQSSPRGSTQQAEAEAQAKLTQLKKVYHRLLDRHTDLELECQSLRSQLEQYETHSDVSRTPAASTVQDTGFDFGVKDLIASVPMSPVSPGRDMAYELHGEQSHRLPGGILAASSASDPSGRRIHAGSFGRANSTTSRSSNQLVMYNQTAPLNDVDSVSRGNSDPSIDAAREKKAAKIQPGSEYRVYGRGGAQNIKLKNKEKKPEVSDKSSKSGFRGLRNIM